MAFENPLLQARGKGTGNPFFPDDKPATQDLPLWQRNELLERLGSATGTTVSKLFGALSVPGSLLYDVASFQPLFSGSTVGDALDSFGLRPSKEALGGWGRPLMELGVGAVTDPLNLVSFGASSAGRAAQAAKAAGLMDDVGRVASRELIDDVASGTRAVDDLGDFGHARNAQDAISNAFNGKGLDAFTDDDLLSRPLVGPRVAARNTRLRDLVDAQADPADAITRVNDHLRLYGQDYTQVADDLLGTDIGLRLPKFMGGEIAARIPLGLGDTSAAAWDRAGQAMRWSLPGRAATSLFSQSTRGKLDEGDQIAAMGWTRADKAGDAAANSIMSRLTREIQEAAPDAFRNPAISAAFRNVVEGVASQADRQLVSSSNLDPFVSRWRSMADDYIDRSRAVGVSSGELQDRYGTEYFPRGVDRDLYARGRRPVDGGRDFSVTAGDQLARSDAYSVPGGTQFINELSRDAAIHNAPTDADAANYIYNAVNNRMHGAQSPHYGLPEYTQQQATKLARDIRGMRPEAIESGRGLFDLHFLEDMGRYVRSRERAVRRANYLHDTVGGASRLENYLNVNTHDFGRHQPVTQVLNNLGLKTIDNRDLMGPVAANMPRAVAGSRQELVERINARLAGTGHQLTVDDLRNVSLDDNTVRRLNSIADFYHSPEIQSRWVEALDGVTQLFKSSVLAWGSRFLRDWYSGMVSNLVEANDASAVFKGYAGARYLQQGQFDRMESLVRQMPRYAGLAAQDLQAAINQYRDELGGTGFINSRGIEDYGAALSNKQTGQDVLSRFAYGSEPVTTFGHQAADLLTGNMPLGFDRTAASELTNLQGYADSIGRFGQALMGRINRVDYMNERQLRDPILRWSAKLGDTTDALNRLAGYNALLLQGVSPAEAARRITRAQVDYGSLTTVEREFFRRVAPFWAYSSRAGAYVASKIWENPGGPYTQLTMRLPHELEKVGQEEGGYTPKQIKETFGLNLEPMRDLPLIGSLVDAVAPKTDGVQSYVNDIDLPGTDLINMLALRSDLNGNLQVGNSLYNTALNTTSQLLHPGLRAGVELLTGQNLHTGKSLTEYEPTTQKIGRALGVEPFGTADSLLKNSNYLVDYIPHAPRVMQLANRLMDTERVPDLQARLAQNAINALSGMKVTNISEDAARLDADRELSAMLGESPALRTFEQRYIPEELLPYASPEDLLLYRMSRQMRSEARKARKRLSDSDVNNPFFN